VVFPRGWKPSQFSNATGWKSVFGARHPLGFVEWSLKVSRCRAPLAAEKNLEKNIMRAVAQMIHEGFSYLGFTILVLLMVVLLPAAALLTRALIPATAVTITLLFVASCFSHRMRDWLYS